MHSFSYTKKGQRSKNRKTRRSKMMLLLLSCFYHFFNRKIYNLFLYSLSLFFYLSLSFIPSIYLLSTFIGLHIFTFFIMETFVSFYVPSSLLLFANTFSVLMQTPHRSSLRSRAAL